MLSGRFSTCGKMRQNRHENSSQFALVIFSQHESFRILMQYINGKCNFSMVKRSVLQLTLRIRQDKTHTCRSRYRSTLGNNWSGITSFCLSNQSIKILHMRRLFCRHFLSRDETLPLLTTPFIHSLESFPFNFRFEQITLKSSLHFVGGLK